MYLILEVKITETGFFHYNEMVKNRLKISLPEERHFYEYKKNRFPIKLEQVENDFIVKPVFRSTSEFFTESWLLYPYNVDSLVENSMTIVSSPIHSLDELDSILKMYGFTYTGKLFSYDPNEDFKRRMTDYFWSYFSSYSKYKVNFFFDTKTNCLTIQNYYQSGNGIKVYFIEDGYWFIPCIPEDNSFALELCKTVQFLLNQYEFISIFGQKK